MNVPLESRDLTSEQWREYDFGGRVYRIENPKILYFRCGGETHRVVDENGVTHCLPAPGEKGCMIRWKADPPASF
jgi:hypothetical protein